MEKSSKKPTNKRAIIADLPNGISAHRLGNGYIRVRLGKKFTGSNAIRKDFVTIEGKAGCRKWIEDQIRDRGALSEMKMTPVQMALAKSAFERLKDIPLNVVVDYYFTSGPGGRGVNLIGDAVELYKEHHVKAGSDPDYVYAQTVSLKLLIETSGNRDLPYFTAVYLDEWFTKMKKTRKWGDINTLNYVRDLKMFFRFCSGRDLIPANPLENHLFVWVQALRKRIKKQLGNVQIYTVDEVKKILETALAHPELDLLAWYVTVFFSGIRVDEMPRMTWGRFRWDEKIISLTQEIAAKGGNARHIEFTDAFLSWIERVPCLRERTGPLFSHTNWRNRLDKLHKIAGVPKKRNAGRHTFGSMYYISTGDAKATRQKLGQETDDVLFRHYISLVEKKDAADFWALRPSPAI